MSVSFSGAFLSHFLFDVTARYKGDAEGFLLGHTASQKQKDGTAQQFSVVEEFIICKQPFSFYNKQGQVDIDELRHLLKGNSEKLIGWFRVRRSTPLQVSIRERSIHQSLQQYCSHLQHSELLFAVFTGDVSPTLATQSFAYGAWTLHGSHFIPYKPAITNLGHTGKSEYQQPAAVSLPCSSPRYQEVISSHRKRFQAEDGTLHLVTDITDLYTGMLTNMQGLCSSLNHANEEIVELRRDIEGLHEAIGRKNSETEPLRLDSSSPLL
ncbi:BRCA1-A complex subunit Abraxas 1-like [Corticium candelabrum]|uniref:BRCA1-A complex subunit Abraxas 1-like n=1 Tax=Corticium candelabrum TaxID=121492 RepID=UPI002E2687F1|nr:BRCA1-A complex subunit Abraxas 1-like [Corticium candelabrum]